MQTAHITSSLNHYKRTQVSTADPWRLIVMCYEGAIGNLKCAREHLENRHFEDKAKALATVQEIIALLMQSIDFQKGGDIAKNLNNLYGYMLKRILEADLRQDPRIFDEVIALLQELESAWKNIAPPAPRDDRDTRSRIESTRLPGGAYGTL